MPRRIRISERRSVWHAGKHSTGSEPEGCLLCPGDDACGLYSATRPRLFRRVVVNSNVGLYNHPSMTVTVRSFAKINLGLRIGPARPDGFHELLTVYQTIGLHDVIRVNVERGTGIEIQCADPRVPRDESNTCYRIVERAMATLRTKG